MRDSIGKVRGRWHGRDAKRPASDLLPRVKRMKASGLVLDVEPDFIAQPGGTSLWRKNGIEKLLSEFITKRM